MTLLLLEAPGGGMLLALQFLQAASNPWPTLVVAASPQSLPLLLKICAPHLGSSRRAGRMSLSQQPFLTSASPFLLQKSTFRGSRARAQQSFEPPLGLAHLEGAVLALQGQPCT